MRTPTKASRTSVLPQLDAWIRYLDKTLGPAPPFRIVPLVLLAKVPRLVLAAWAKEKGLWQIATLELVDWCKHFINGRSAIEIGAGRGSLGIALGIPQTDIVGSRMVEALSALPAVAKYKPDVVIGAWVVQKGDLTQESTAPSGVDEVTLIGQVKAYVMIGNAHVHSHSAVMAYPHEELTFPWLTSRSTYSEQDKIYVWGK